MYRLGQHVVPDQWIATRFGEYIDASLKQLLEVANQAGSLSHGLSSAQLVLNALG